MLKDGDPLRTVHSFDPREARKAAFTAILDRVDADYAGFYSLSEIDGELYATDWQFERDGGIGDPIMREVALEPYPGAPYLQIHRPDPRALRAFLEASSIADSESLVETDVFRKVMKPLGIADQIRLLVYHGARFIGSVVAIRRPGGRAFTKKDAARLSPLVSSTIRSFTAADEFAHSDVPDGGAHFLIRPDGRIDYASAGPTFGWLESPGLVDTLRRSVRLLDRGETGPTPVPLLRAQARLTRLDGPLGVAYLAHVIPAPAPHRAADAVLSPAQRVVGDLAASGATVPEIAAHLGKSPNTIQTQLRQIYQKLDVGSRLELARTLEKCR